MSKREIYISVDIETGGPIPGKFSMLSLGACVVDDSFKLTGEEYWINLEELPGTSIDPVTKTEFWDKNPEAWKACRKNLLSPKDGMKQFDSWLSNLEKKYNAKLVFVSYPNWDFTFVHWYLMEFVGNSRFSFASLDMKTLAMALLKTKFRDVGKRTMPKQWFDPKLKHTHVAVEDAREQGITFSNMMKELYKL